MYKHRNLLLFLHTKSKKNIGSRQSFFVEIMYFFDSVIFYEQSRGNIGTYQLCDEDFYDNPG